MGSFEKASILVSVAALFSFLNLRFLKLPSAIGIMLLSVIGSLVIILAGIYFPTVRTGAAQLVAGIDFHRTLLHGMLAFLLFAGSLQLRTEDLSREWDAIAVLSVLGTALSTVLVGYGCHWVFARAGLQLPLLPCMILGALISPTDPIAVLAIIRRLNAPRSLEAVMAGESLFNDGIGVVIFLALSAALTAQHALTARDVITLLVREAAGGVGVGLAGGMIVVVLLGQVDYYQVEILLTVALAMGGYVLADALGVSAPIAIVVAGLFIGSRGRARAMSETTREHLDMFWELIDEVTNAVLFLLVGLVILVIPFRVAYLLAGSLTVFIVLIARWISVAGCVGITQLWRPRERGRITVLTWGGLRGGLSIAMALSLPEGTPRNILLVCTYCVVVFCIFVQGLSVERVIRKVCT
jgi:CPA1 family monovalent cation:H+ antiporter